MHLNKITLNNFRYFKHLEIALHPKVTVLVGPNGAGKTTILDGIATALSQVLSLLSSANQRLSGRGIEDTDFRMEPVGTQNGSKRWKMADYAQVMAETTDGVCWDYWKPSGLTGTTPQTKYGMSALKKYLVPIYESYGTDTPKLTPVFAYYGTRRGMIDVPARLGESRGKYDYPTSALIGALDSRNDFKEFLRWFDRAEAADLRARNHPDDVDDGPSVALESLRSTVKTLLGDGYGKPYFNKEHKFVIEPEGGGAPLSIDQLSQGYQSMLGLGMDFARRLALANGHLSHADEDAIGDAPLRAPAIMLIDEIDLHLHPIWQQRVLGDLMRAFPHTQFIVTTHSPQVLTSVDGSCVRMIQEEVDPATGERQTVARGIHQQTKGVASSDVLFEIMGANPIPPVLEAKWFADYTNKIEDGTHDDDEGQCLRRRLDEHFGKQHPLMLDADRLIRFQAFKLSKKPTSQA